MTTKGLSASCIFCKIIRQEIPSFKIAETAKSYAFLDIGPTAKGHVLVIPKYCGEKLNDIPDEYLSDILPLVKKIAIASDLNIKGLEGVGYNVLQNNGHIAHQVVPHVHFHLIPKRDNETGLGVEWPQPEDAKDKEDLEKQYTKLVEKLKL